MYEELPKTIGAVATRQLIKAAYPGAVYKVFWHIWYITDQTCVIHESQKEMAEATGLSRSSIHRALQYLMEDDHIYRDGEHLYLNPLTAFTGWGGDHQEAIARMPERLRPDATAHHLKPVS